MSKSSTTTMNRRTMRANLLPNPTPGEILLEEFLKPMALSQNALARAIRVPPRRINEIVLGNGRSPPIRICDSPVILECRRDFFSAFRPTMTLMARKREIAGELRSIATRAA